MGDGAHPGIAARERSADGPWPGVLINVSIDGLVAFCMASELAAIPFILAVRRRLRAGD
jgi:hypothetical protein